MNEKTARKGKEKKNVKRKEKRKETKINVLHFKRAFPLVKSIF
jgi:hypothetical protein